MSEGPRLGWRWLRFWLPFAALALLLFCVGGWVLTLSDIYRSHQSFPGRHAEATSFIEAVYRHYSTTGQWPDAGIASQLYNLPSKWTYQEHVDPSEPQSAPVLILHGPYHMLLAYYFVPPDNGKASRRWTKSWEGDKGEFNTNESYRP